MKHETVDLRGVTCGLVPNIVSHLKSTSAGVVDFNIRMGIRNEIMNGFGTGGCWDMEFLDDLGSDILRFTKKVKSPSDLLNIVEY